MSKRKIGCDYSKRQKKLKKTKGDRYYQSKFYDSSSDTDDWEGFSRSSYKSDDSQIEHQESNDVSHDYESSLKNSTEQSSYESDSGHNCNKSDIESGTDMNSDDSTNEISENGSSELTDESNQNFEVNECSSLASTASNQGNQDFELNECSSFASTPSNQGNQNFDVNEYPSFASISSDRDNQEREMNECMSSDDGSEYQESVDGERSITSEYRGSENDTDDDLNKENPILSKDLAYYAVKSGTPQEYVNFLLKILHKNKVNKDHYIPKSYATLVGTPKKKIEQRPMESGNYFTYKSIQDSLAAYESYLLDKEIIEIDIGVDGFKPFKSSALDMWPVMGSVVGLINLRPFLLGCYEGRKSPKDSDALLKDVCDEIEVLNEEGTYLPVSKKTVKFRVRIFCLDAPARAMVCAVMSHSGYEGCPLCKMPERINDRKVIYTSTIGKPRTNETYSSRLYSEHHKPRFRKNHSRLESLFKMVDQFPIDPMHCIELGDMKAMLELMKLKKTGSKIKIEEISSRMTSFRKPNDFSRDCRSLSYLQFFKATELRFLLFYSCIVFLKGLVDDYVYRHVLLLHCAVRLLSNDDLKPEDIDVAEEFLVEYVRLYPMIYGEENVTYNVHVLMHIPYYARLYGTLDSFSMFKFENFIQTLKGFVRKAQHPLQQLSNRLDEFSRIVDGAEKCVKFNSFELTENERDSFIGIKHNENIIPARFLRFETKNGTKYVKILRCLQTKSFYDWPVDSKQLGEISYEHLSSTEETFAEKEVFFKYCRFPFENIFVLIPILHTSFLGDTKKSQ